MKIVYCTDSLNHLGGIQRATTVKASALAAIPGNEICIATAEGAGGSIFPLDARVKVIDMDVRYYSDDWKSRWHLFKSTLKKRREHKKRLKKVLEEIRPDVVISTGTSDKFFLPSIAPRGSVVIREIHFFSRYRRLHAHGRFEKLKARIGDIWDYGIKLREYDRTYLLTEEDRALWKKGANIGVMPNPGSFTPKALSPEREKTVIAAGRYSSPKRFDNLLRIWSLVAPRFPDWRLEIWGEGELRKELEELIGRLDIGGSAFLKGYTADLEMPLSNAAIFALTSDHEGFPLVLLEAMACGVVPVCFACRVGPGDIITDGENGFLIPPGDLDRFAEKLMLLMGHDGERRAMAQKTVARAAEFTPEEIARRWMEQFEFLRRAKFS